MNPPPAPCPSELTALLEEKANALTGFVSASESLLGCLTAGDLESLPAILENRQKLSRCIDEMDARIEAALRKISPDGENPPGAIRLNRFRGRFEDLLRKSAELEAQCLRAVESQRDRTKKEILALRQGRKAARQYLQRAGMQPRIMDLKK